MSVNRDHISGEFRDMIVRDWDSDLLVLKLGSYDIWQEVCMCAFNGCIVLFSCHVYCIALIELGFFTFVA